MVETRNRWHSREMFKELYLKYPEGRIRLPVGSQFEDSFQALDKIPAESEVDMNNSKSGGAIVGAFSGEIFPNFISYNLIICTKYYFHELEKKFRCSSRER